MVDQQQERPQLSRRNFFKAAALGPFVPGIASLLLTGCEAPQPAPVAQAKEQPESTEKTLLSQREKDVNSLCGQINATIDAIAGLRNDSELAKIRVTAADYYPFLLLKEFLVLSPDQARQKYGQDYEKIANWVKGQTRQEDESFCEPEITAPNDETGQLAKAVVLSIHGTSLREYKDRIKHISLKKDGENLAVTNFGLEELQIPAGQLIDSQSFAEFKRRVVHEMEHAALPSCVNHFDKEGRFIGDASGSFNDNFLFNYLWTTAIGENPSFFNERFFNHPNDQVLSFIKKEKKHNNFFSAIQEISAMLCADLVLPDQNQRVQVADWPPIVKEATLKTWNALAFGPGKITKQIPENDFESIKGFIDWVSFDKVKASLTN